MLGDTDSERMFALITAETRRCGDLGEGIVAAIGWIVANLPLLALNFVLTTPTDLWALRYPETHDLFVLDRPSGGTDTTQGLDASSDRIHATAPELVTRASVVVATERMDDDPGWRPLAAGELLHVDRDLTLRSSYAVPGATRPSAETGRSRRHGGRLAEFAFPHLSEAITSSGSGRRRVRSCRSPSRPGGTGP